MRDFGGVLLMVGILPFGNLGDTSHLIAVDRHVHPSSISQGLLSLTTASAAPRTTCAQLDPSLAPPGTVGGHCCPQPTSSIAELLFLQAAQQRPWT